VLVRTVLGLNLSAAFAFLRTAAGAASFLKAAPWVRFFCAAETSDGVGVRRSRQGPRPMPLGGDGDSGGDEYLGRCWATWIVSCAGGGESGGLGTDSMLEDMEERGEESAESSSEAIETGQGLRRCLCFSVPGQQRDE